MIKANELRIGNWVMYYDKPLKVDDLTYLYDLDDDWEGWVMNGAPIEKDRFEQKAIDPIRITPEILEKAGFEGTDGDYSRHVWGFNLCIFIGYDCHIDGERIQYIEYVHQLQNLYFALTGEELNIAF